MLVYLGTGCPELLITGEDRGVSGSKIFIGAQVADRSRFVFRSVILPQLLTPRWYGARRSLPWGGVLLPVDA